jgi:hypothetical protein
VQRAPAPYSPLRMVVKSLTAAVRRDRNSDTVESSPLRGGR